MRLSPPLRGLALISMLSACVAATPAEVSKNEIGARLGLADLPAMQSFQSAAPLPALRGNREMAADFLDLHFRMESGRTLPYLTRFEGPVTVALTGSVPAIAPVELRRLIARLRAEAGIDISLARPGQQASITIDFRPRASLRRAVPSAACFVVPNVRNFADYARARLGMRTDWGALTRREQVAIFVPSDTSPQEVRDCLHEEVAQALGPLNDLFRLPDSVFNDDNFHAVLTGFDMLMLRALYAPELRSGMTEAEVAARLPGLLARLNPAGEGRGGTLGGPTTRTWITSVESAFSGRGGARLAMADRLVSIARAEGWSDGRLAFSHFARARARTGGDIPGAAADYQQALRIWSSIPGAAIHVAHVEMQLAAFALSSGDAQRVLELTRHALPVAERHQNASLLASLLAMRAEALDLLGQSSAARSARLDSLGWARYAFGSDAQVRARMQDIAALVGRARRG